MNLHRSISWQATSLVGSVIVDVIPPILKFNRELIVARILFACMFYLLLMGCTESPPGSDPNSLPLPNISYASRHTYPMVMKAASSKLAARDTVFAIEIETSDISLVKIVESELANVMDFIPVSQIDRSMGHFVDSESRAPAKILSIACCGSQSDWLRFHVECNSGDEMVTYEVLLRAREGDYDWHVAHVKEIPDEPTGG